LDAKIAVVYVSSNVIDALFRQSYVHVVQGQTKYSSYR